MPKNDTPQKSNGRRALISLIKKLSDDFLVDNAFLKHLAHNEISHQEWQAFAIQRYLAAQPFEALLAACAHAFGQIRVGAVVRENLRDETGTDEDDVIHSDRAHSTWRKNFYEAMGITEDCLTLTKHSVGTKRYTQTVNALIATSDPLMMAGALLALEALIPREFMYVKAGRDRLFPNLSKEARLYIDDHITHDARSHFPALLSALEDYAECPGDLKRIEIGAQRITEAKIYFYQNLNP